MKKFINKIKGNISGNSFLRLLQRFVVNKYLLVTILGVVWLLFDDEYNLIEYNKKRQEKNRIEREISYYRRLSKESEDRMRQIETDMGSLEKFAREQFLMKRANEDIFLFE